VTDPTAAEMLQAFGYDSKTAQQLSTAATRKGLNVEDVQAWIEEAQGSHSLNNPLGFVRARLQDGDKPPASCARPCHERQRYTSQLPGICKECHTRPCICNWNPAEEPLFVFLFRVYGRGTKLFWCDHCGIFQGANPCIVCGCSTTPLPEKAKEYLK
jgi:hypothetical protein